MPFELQDPVKSIKENSITTGLTGRIVKLPVPNSRDEWYLIDFNLGTFADSDPTMWMHAKDIVPV
jgi:hypothetical protein